MSSGPCFKKNTTSTTQLGAQYFTKTISSSSIICLRLGYFFLSFFSSVNFNTMYFKTKPIFNVLIHAGLMQSFFCLTLYRSKCFHHCFIYHYSLVVGSSCSLFAAFYRLFCCFSSIVWTFQGHHHHQVFVAIHKHSYTPVQ